MLLLKKLQKKYHMIECVKKCCDHVAYINEAKSGDDYTLDVFCCFEYTKKV
jgi:hypothetical protein